MTTAANSANDEASLNRSSPIGFAGTQNTDTPLPPEEPRGENPPDGAILYYSLPAQLQWNSRSWTAKAA